VAAAIQAKGISVPFDQNLINFVYVSFFCGVNTEPFTIFKRVYYMINASLDLYTRWRFIFNLIIVGQNNNFTFSQNAQVTIVVRVLTSLKTFGDSHTFGVQTITKIMLNARVNLKNTFALAHDFCVTQVISRPLARMLIADAVPAMVLMNPPGPNAAPVISGNVYVSDGWSVLALTIKF
jgi:hypothetical protein